MIVSFGIAVRIPCEARREDSNMEVIRKTTMKSLFTQEW